MKRLDISRYFVLSLDYLNCYQPSTLKNIFSSLNPENISIFLTCNLSVKCHHLHSYNTFKSENVTYKTTDLYSFLEVHQRMSEVNIKLQMHFKTTFFFLVLLLFHPQRTFEHRLIYLTQNYVEHFIAGTNVKDY